MYVEPKRLNDELTFWWRKEMVVQIVFGSKNIIESVVRILRKEPLFKIFWVYGDIVFKERKKV